MKKLIFLFLFTATSLIAFGQAKQDTKGNLIGYAQKSDFLKKQYKGWFQHHYKNYEPEKEIVKKIKKKLRGVSVMCFMGTWCGDSKRETPRFYKIMEQAGFDFNKNFKLIALNRLKKTPDNLQANYNIIRIPTFIFYRRGKELGRYVEYPRESMEKDILKILEGKPYKHSYDRK
jgi:thiol-disulfide isomerase/thioredoxin